MFTLEQCLNARITGNSFEGDLPGMNVALTGTKRQELKLDRRQKLKVD